MSTLATLMYALRDPGITPYNQQELTEQRIRGSMLQNQTSLLALEEARRQQQAEAAYRQAVQQNPGLLFGGGGQQPLLAQLSPGALPQTDGPPGAITQQAFGPSGPGATQTIPAPMDLSRFATGTPPPGGPVLARVGQPQGPVGGAQEVLFNLARQNPDAAALLQQRLQQQHDVQWKLQEQQLTIREKVAGYIARNAQTIRSQAQLDSFRADLQKAGLAQYAASLPEWYSEAAMTPLITSAQSSLENAQTALATAKAAQAQQQMLTEQYNREVFLPRLLGEETGPAPRGGAPERGPAPGTQPPATTGPMKAAPTEIEGYIAESHRLYPQVRPELIRATMLQESYYNPNARGSAGEMGLMQLKPGTARDMGVNPSDPRDNTRGGTRYLAQLLTRYSGDERRALAAYNQGMGRVPLTGDIPEAGARYADEVLGRIRGGQAGTATRATTPAASPQLGQIQGQIARLEQQVDLAAKGSVLNPGLNTLADNLRAQLERLYKERDRLEELPRKVQEAEVLSPYRQREAAAQGREAAEIKQQAERNQPLVQKVGEDKAAQYRDRTTGEPIDSSQMTGDVYQQMSGKNPRVIALSAKQTENLDKIQSVLPVLQELKTALQRVYGPGGIFENLSPKDRAAAAVKGGWARFAQTNPDLATYARLIESNVDVVRRALQGQVGTQTEQDAVRGTGAFARTTGIPDSQDVAYQLVDAFNSMVQGNMRTILRNPQYTHETLKPMVSQVDKFRKALGD